MRRYDLALILFFVTVFLLPLFLLPIRTPGDFAVAAAAEQMIRTGEPVMPAAMSSLPLRPIAQYWMTAGAFRLFGVSAFSLHFFPLLAVALTALLSGAVIRQCTDDKSLAQLSMFFFLGCFGTIFAARDVFAPVAMLFVTSAEYFFYLAIRENGVNFPKANLLILSGLAAAAAVLSSGVMVLLPIFGVMVLFLLLEQRCRELGLAGISFLCTLLFLAPYYCSVRSTQLPLRNLLRDQSTLAFFSGDTIWSELLLKLGLLLLPTGIFALLLLMKSARSGRLVNLPARNSLALYALAFAAGNTLFWCLAFGAKPGELTASLPPVMTLIAVGVTDYLRSSEQRKGFHLLLDLTGAILIGLGAALLIRNGFGGLTPAGMKWNWDGISLTGAGILVLAGIRRSPRGRFSLFGAAIAVLALFPIFSPDARIDSAAEFRRFAPLYQAQGSIIYADPEAAPLARFASGRNDVRLFGAANAAVQSSAADGRSFNDCIRQATKEHPVLLLAPKKCSSYGDEEGVPTPAVYPCGNYSLAVWPIETPLHVRFIPQ